MDIPDIWVLEWSQRQNAFHIQRAQSAMETNLNSLLSNNKTDYITVMIGSREKCDAVADKARHYIKEREKKHSMRLAR